MGLSNRGMVHLGLEFSWILLHVGAAGACTVTVAQLGTLEVDGTQAAVTINCSFSAHGCPPGPPASLWFRLGSRPEQLCAAGCSGQADKFTVRAVPEQSLVSLTVHAPTANDSAIYICGIAFPSANSPRAKQTGDGTMLVIRESKPLSKDLQSLLTALLTLLCIYVAGVAVIFVILSKSKSNILRNKETKEDSQKKKSARRVFQEIAQELYHKRYVETSQQPEKDITYENRSALSNYERP